MEQQPVHERNINLIKLQKELKKHGAGNGAVVTFMSTQSFITLSIYGIDKPTEKFIITTKSLVKNENDLKHIFRVLSSNNVYTTVKCRKYIDALKHTIGDNLNLKFAPFLSFLNEMEKFKVNPIELETNLKKLKERKLMNENPTKLIELNTNELYLTGLLNEH